MFGEKCLLGQDMHGARRWICGIQVLDQTKTESVEMITTILTKADAPEKSPKINVVLRDAEKPIPSYPKHKFLKWEFETQIKWSNVVFISLWHIIAIYGFISLIFHGNRWIIIYMVSVGSIAGFGVTGGAHRFFTHRSFKAKLPLRIILMLCFSATGQNTLVDWVRDHRVHHKYSETDADPHNAKRGFFFSHVGWLMLKKHPEVIRQGRKIDYSDLLEDPVVVFHQKYFFWLKLMLCFIIPTAIPIFLLGQNWHNSIMAICFVRYVISLNSIWAVNSVAHLWGNKPYDKKIYPSENLAVSFMSLGEGYHNYHHTFPWDYRAAEVGQLLNVTTFWLNIFEKIGWAYDMKAPSEQLIKKVVQNHGDESHYRWGHEVPVSENDGGKLEEKKL